MKNLDELDSDTQSMEALGYIAKGEFGIPGRRFFQKGELKRSHQIHAFRAGTEDVQRHLAFRDYLISFPNIALAYGLLKKEGITICGNDIGVYCDHKDSFIKEHGYTSLSIKGGFILAHWDGTPETEEKIKQDTKATIRCIPYDSVEEEGVCILTGNKSTRKVLFAKAY